VSAATARIVAGDRATAGTHAAAEWEQIEQVAPELAVTMRRYLAQAATFLAPRSVDATNGALRQLAAGCWPAPASSRSPSDGRTPSRGCGFQVGTAGDGAASCPAAGQHSLHERRPRVHRPLAAAVPPKSMWISQAGVRVRRPVRPLPVPEPEPGREVPGHRPGVTMTEHPRRRYPAHLCAPTRRSKARRAARAVVKPDPRISAATARRDIDVADLTELLTILGQP
jgi:hypothetical protein